MHMEYMNSIEIFEIQLNSITNNHHICKTDIKDAIIITIISYMRRNSDRSSFVFEEIAVNQAPAPESISMGSDVSIPENCRKTTRQHPDTSQTCQGGWGIRREGFR
jgi:hypothetical protein